MISNEDCAVSVDMENPISCSEIIDGSGFCQVVSVT